MQAAQQQQQQQLKLVVITASAAAVPWSDREGTVGHHPHFVLHLILSTGTSTISHQSYEYKQRIKATMEDIRSKR